MHIDEQNTNIIPLRYHVFIQDRGAYKHKNAGNKMFTKIMLPMVKLDTDYGFRELCFKF